MFRRGMTCAFCHSEIPDTQPFNFCPFCGQYTGNQRRQTEVLLKPKTSIDGSSRWRDLHAAETRLHPEHATNALRIFRTFCRDPNLIAMCVHGAPLIYIHSETAFMTEEYRILEEIDEHQILMEEARMVGENIMAIVHSIKDLWFPTLEELRLSSPYPHLTEYSLNVLEGMGLVTHSDLNDPYWNDCRPDRTNTEGYRAVDRRDPHWIALVIASADSNRKDQTERSSDYRQHRPLLSCASCPSGVRSARISARRHLFSERVFDTRRSRKRVSAKPLSGHLGPGERKKWKTATARC